jgi:hypothetical protein
MERWEKRGEVEADPAEDFAIAHAGRGRSRSHRPGRP